MLYSICIPTCNRQDVCLLTIKDFARAIKPGVEVCVSDNSEDSNLLESKLFELFDGSLPPWLKFKKKPKDLPILSMRANWEEALNLSSGDWVTFIGDDDYVSPEVCNLLERLRNHDEKFDFLGWSHLRFQWPGLANNDVTVDINLSNKLVPFPIQKGFQTILECFGPRPVGMHSPYHGAIHRSLIDRVRTSFGDSGIYFKHSNVDYHTGWVGATRSDRSAFCVRPLSVAGASKNSNSAFTRGNGGPRKGADIVLAQLQNDKSAGIGVVDSCKTRSFGSLTEYFYYLSLDFIALDPSKKGFEGNWPSNLKERFEAELRGFGDVDSFEQVRDEMTAFIQRENLPIRIEQEFTPLPPHDQLARGFHDGKLYVLNSAFNSKTAGEFFNFVDQMLRPISHLGNDVQVQKRA